MRTEVINVYQFDELSEQAKQKAIEKEGKYLETSYIYDDARNSVNEFIRRVNVPIKTSRNSFLDVYLGEIDDMLLILTGNRLRTYLINNMDFLYKPKYIKSFDGHKTHKMIINKTAQGTGKKYCAAYSKINFDTCCNLTGVCYDDSILEPIYEFINKPNNTENLEDIINECFDNLKKDIESEIEYLQSKEGIIETIKANEYEFTEDGERF